MVYPMARGAASAVSTFHALGETAVDPELEDTTVELTAAPTPAEGTRYRNLGRLGEGGMGRVTHMYDADLMRDLAVKELIPERKGSLDMMRLFLWEARVTAYLDHPNIVPLHDMGLSDEGGPWFTMKLVDGRSLEAVLDDLRAVSADADDRLPLSRRLRMFLQLGQAIEFAHSRGVLHRDLKPTNVMLGEHGELYVMDWGIAAPLDGPTGEKIAAGAPPDLLGPGPGKPSGTPLYMSPEQASASPLDVRSDVYTLGVILYEMVALRTPYPGQTVAELTAAIITGSIVPVVKVQPDISPSLAAVIEHALSLRPEDRYPTVAALTDDLETVLDGGTPQAETAGLMRRIGRFYLRDRNPWLQSSNMLVFELMMGSACSLGAWLALLLSGGPTVWMLSMLVICIAFTGTATALWVHRGRRWKDRSQV